jgi:VWFA-related protein
MRPIAWRAPVLTALLALAAVRPGGSQAPSPSPARTEPRVTFSSEVAYVEVDAIVTDGQGQPVRGLRPEDFEVLEDGQRRDIQLFTQVDIPYERPEPLAPPAVEPDVRTNTQPFEGRVYVLVMDGLHTGVSRSGQVKAAARQFLERHFAAGDLAAVVHTWGGAAAGQELTDNRRLLLASVDRFLGRKLQSVTQSRIEEYRRTRELRDPQDPVADPEAMQRAFDARAAFDTLRSVADWLAAIRGRRKAIVFLSEGVDYDIYDSIKNREASEVLDALRQATAAAARANASIYSVDPRGLGGLSTETMEIQPVVDDDPSLGLDVQGLDRDFRRAQDSLRVLSDETSGLAAVNTNDYAGAFARMVKDNSVYYVLGFYPPGPRKEGRFHRLDVRVSRPGLKVRARSGYSVPRGKRAERPDRPGTPAPLAPLLDSALPRPGLAMEVQAAPFRGPGKKANVMVALEVARGQFRFTEKAGQSLDTLQLSIAAVDQGGRNTVRDQTVQLNLTPRTRQLVDAAGFRVLSWLELEPGRYQLRVAGRAVSTEAAGSVFYDLEVPDFTKPSLAMSGLALTSALARLVPTAGSSESLKDVLPGPPATWRAFPVQDTLSLATEVYDGEKTPHTVDVVTSLTGADGTSAYRSAEERPASAGATLVYTAQVPLKDVAPGLYTLRVEARSRTGHAPPVQRATVVQVLPGAPAPSPPPAPPGQP